jgi:hypothetical protein
MVCSERVAMTDPTGYAAGTRVLNDTV